MNGSKNKGLLYGLVLGGGKSARMGQDKSTLEYFKKPQVEYGYELLLPLCDQVFISNRKEQADLPGHKGLPQIHDDDVYQGIGPLAGILSAMQRFPNAAWFVLACDLPFLNKKTIKNVLTKRNIKKLATAYRSSHDGLPEPLCAIWEPQAKEEILRFLKQGVTCPRKILINSDAQLLDLEDKRTLDNVNSKEEYVSAIKAIKSEKH
ncbi:MAG: hypothetical protein A2Z88_04420 [Omnitrophica WOR_2 bacterium GWA2_47_8]|nr:MAG: hypothetical protein A2Z88_04420 [Omnitrophica WOR_2 bacterium GWA2_47_8]